MPKVTLDTFFQFTPSSPLDTEWPYDIPIVFVEAYGDALRGIEVDLQPTVGGSYVEREVASVHNFLQINQVVQQVFKEKIGPDPQSLLPNGQEFAIESFGKPTRALGRWDYNASGAGYFLYTRLKVEGQDWSFDPQQQRYVEVGGEEDHGEGERVFFEVSFVVQTPSEDVEQ